MKAPRHADLPEPRPKSARGKRLGKVPISVSAEVVTPILGGSSRTREVDAVDVIRPATVRGHLRFWWRALNAHRVKTAEELHEQESSIWGRAMAGEGQGGRSEVEIRVDVGREGKLDESPIDLKSPDAYALWPAREPLAFRRSSGTRFKLTLLAPEEQEDTLRDVLRAWLLFGGYGSRTRRGLGSFAVLGDPRPWLPARATPEAFSSLFGRDLFAPPGKAACDTPWFAGAALQVGSPERNAVTAWTAALGWLREFRQGTGSGSRHRAREPGKGKPQPNRPSISNWPEPDKIRHLAGKTKAHPPRHNATPAWPRAGFGLPIGGEFQKTGRRFETLDEPRGKFALHWMPPGSDKERDRLASPLIVKALPLADGSFVPAALWLNRAHPTGEVVLSGYSGSRAPFDRLVAPGDTPLFSALAGKGSLREAFLSWLQTTHQTRVVAP